MTQNPIIHAAALDAARQCLRDYQDSLQFGVTESAFFWCGRLSRAFETLIDTSDTGDGGEG